MSRVIIATGRLAENPYRIEKIERNIYSIEELCYSLVQSAQFLDKEIMDPALVTWIGTELGLEDLQKKLTPYLGKSRALSDFVSTILDYTGYISQDKQMRTRQIVASGQGMEPYERRMKHARYLEDNGRLYDAIEEYESLLADLPEPERELRSRIYTRMGLIYAGLFRFRLAADSFGKAYDLSGDNEIYLKYLAAIRFGLSDAEYVSFISEHPEAYNASMELEKRMKAAGAAFEKSEMELMIERLRRYKSAGQETNYEIALHQTIQKLKDDYRMSKTSSIQ